MLYNVLKHYFVSENSCSSTDFKGRIHRRTWELLQFPCKLTSSMAKWFIHSHLQSKLLLILEAAIILSLRTCCLKRPSVDAVPSSTQMTNWHLQRPLHQRLDQWFQGLGFDMKSHVYHFMVQYVICNPPLGFSSWWSIHVPGLVR